MDYGAIRGFNYQPSYSRTLMGIWADFDAEVWRREVGWSLRFGTNMLRIWMDWHVHVELGEKLLDNLGRALDILAENGIKMMPVLFNRWVDAKYPAGGVSDNDLRSAGWDMGKFESYVEAVGRRFGRDQRIAIWDICNEPSNNISPDVQFREYVWMAWAADRLRRFTDYPVTIGSMNYDFFLQAAPLCDVISFHPYTRSIGEIDGFCRYHLEMARRYGKPLIATETCCGSFDDQERGRLARDNIETLERHGIGWLAWQLCEGKFVTANRQLTDDNAVRPGEGYMPFILADGTTRPGHHWLERRA
ncbi:MAG: glycoside hydrolase family 5 protein [Phycisphaerae bacterium]|nr:glycoside hydrolase family 5 protein [Phycisphaerae bacterium]